MGHGARVDVDDDFAFPRDDQAAGVGHLAQPGVLHGPLVHDRFKRGDVLRGDHGHHAFLRLGHQDFARGQGGVAEQDGGQLDFHAAVAVGGELGRGAGDARGAEVLDALNQGALEQLEAALDQDLLGEGVAHLDGGALGRLGVVEGLRGQHGGAADAVAAGAGAEQHHLVALAGGVGEADVLVPHDADGEGVDQRVALVHRVEDHFAADVRQAQGVAVAADAGHGAVHDAGRVRVVDGAEAQRIHHGHRAGAHGDDVADDAADAGRGALVGLHERRRVVGLDLERHGPAVAQVGDTGVLADAHQHVLLHLVGDLFAELAQVVLRGLVGAVLAPHHGVHGELGAGRAAAQDLDDLVELVLLQAQLGPGEFDVRGLGRVLDGVDVELLGLGGGAGRPAR